MWRSSSSESEEAEANRFFGRFSGTAATLAWRRDLWQCRDSEERHKPMTEKRDLRSAVLLLVAAASLSASACDSDSTRPIPSANVVIRSASQTGSAPNYNVTLSLENTGGPGYFRVDFYSDLGRGVRPDVAVDRGYRGIAAWTSAALVSRALVYSRPDSSSPYRVTDTWVYATPP